MLNIIVYSMLISALSGLDYIRALFPAVLLSYSVI